MAVADHGRKRRAPDPEACRGLMQGQRDRTVATVRLKSDQHGDPVTGAARIASEPGFALHVDSVTGKRTHVDEGAEKGEHAILEIMNPKESALDLPYRWLPLDYSGEDKSITFQIETDGSSFSKSCELIEIGDEAIVYGPMG